MLSWNAQIFFWKGHIIKPLQNHLPDGWGMGNPVHDTQEQSMEVRGMRASLSEDWTCNKEQTRDQSSSLIYQKKTSRYTEIHVLVPN